MTLETGRLDEKQRERFDRDGYLVIDPSIPDAVLSGVLGDLGPRYMRKGDAPVLEGGVLYSPGKPRIRDAWRISENVKAIALAPKVLAILADLYGREPHCFQTLNFEVPTQQAAHSDSMHFSPDPREFMCGVWVALEDIDADNGPVFYYPGSHKLPFLDYEDVGFRSQRSDFPDRLDYSRARNSEYEAHVAGLIEHHGFEAQYATLKRGQALIWAANLLHGGAPLRDPNRTRQSQVSHYLFEGSTGYYTALVSDPDHRIWSDVEWVG